MFPYCVTDGRNFRLKDVDPSDTGPLRPEDKAHAKKTVTRGIEALASLQDMLYAQACCSSSPRRRHSIELDGVGLHFD
jgi:hypothetical protein